MAPTPQSAIVYLIDDEECVRRSMGRLFRSAGMQCRCFSSVDEFLQANCPCEGACVVSDIRMTGRSALGLPAHLRQVDQSIPVVFITAYDTPENRDAALRAGAAGYFCKPVDDQALLDAIEWAVGVPPSAEGRAGPESAQPEDKPSEDRL
jgi:FixJ family two-component response regulator